MKVVEATGSDGRTTSKIDLGIDHLPLGVQNKIKNEVGEFLVGTILLTLQDAKSPVAGESFPALSKNYKEKKIALGGVGKPNMELEGDMLSSLAFKPIDGGIELGFFDSEAAKADGHLKFSGRENHTPQRRFLPGEGQSFKRGIEQEVKKIILENLK